VVGSKLPQASRPSPWEFGVSHNTLSQRELIEAHELTARGDRAAFEEINEYVERSLMLVTALAPVIGYDKASKIAHYAADNLTLKAAALKLGFVDIDVQCDPRGAL